MKSVGIFFSVVFYVMTSMVSAQEWTVCPPNGITTNPNAPVNTQNPYFVNDFFDWTINL